MKAPAGDNATSAPLLQAKITIPASSTATGGGAEAALLGKGRYKVWALAAIALLALWSMSAASVSLRWSAGDLAAFGSGDLEAPLRDDLDSLEMEEREKLVGRMWDMYTRTTDEVRLPRFWQEAFEAAYEELAGDDMQVRDAAISEIARMSAHRLELEQPVNANEHDDIPEDVPNPSIPTNKRKKSDETAATTDGDATDDETLINLIRKKARTTPQEPNTPTKEKTPVKIATTQEKAKQKTPEKKATSQEKAKKKTPVKKTTI